MLRFPAFENATVKRPEWALASDVAIASWLKLATHAAIAENGGRFIGAVSWDDRAWTIMASVTLTGVEAAVAAGICRWDGTVLEVLGYETKAEAIVQQRRAHGKNGGRPTKTTRDNHAVSQAANHTDNHVDNHTGNRAGKPLSSPLPSVPSPSGRDSADLGCADSAPVYAFPADAVVGDGTGPWGVTSRLHQRMVSAFPGVDVSAEYPRVLSWLETNTVKRKTRSGMPRFLNSWMSRQQNDARRNGAVPRDGLRAVPALPTTLDMRR